MERRTREYLATSPTHVSINNLINAWIIQKFEVLFNEYHTLGIPRELSKFPVSRLYFRLIKWEFLKVETRYLKFLKLPGNSIILMYSPH